MFEELFLLTLFYVLMGSQKSDRSPCSQFHLVLRPYNVRPCGKQMNLLPLQISGSFNQRNETFPFLSFFFLSFFFGGWGGWGEVLMDMQA